MPLVRHSWISSTHFCFDLLPLLIEKSPIIEIQEQVYENSSLEDMIWTGCNCRPGVGTNMLSGKKTAPKTVLA